MRNKIAAQGCRLQNMRPSACNLHPISATELKGSTRSHLKCRERKEDFSFSLAAAWLLRGRPRADQYYKLMKTLAAKGNWNIAKGKLKQKLAQLTYDDLRFLEGKEDELIGRIQKHAEKTKGSVKRAGNEFSNHCKS